MDAVYAIKYLENWLRFNGNGDCEDVIKAIRVVLEVAKSGLPDKHNVDMFLYSVCTGIPEKFDKEVVIVKSEFVKLLYKEIFKDDVYPRWLDTPEWKGE